ncbi:MAG TPA: hypothetical protein VE127_07430, partial [Solirubrobacteraceae bacterium]|nr:hypothetical protein [Solirubrobacteraceae bacterium]
VLAQVDTARRHGAREVHVIATAAVRAAADGADLVRAIADATGLPVTVMSEAEEARLAFLGAAGMMDEAPAGALGVIDVGGGSSEIVVGRAPDRIDWWSSVAIGSGTLSDRHLLSDPPTAAELAAARAVIARLLPAQRPPRPDTAVAVGGSAASLCRVAGPVLDPDALRRSLDLLAAAPAAIVAERFGVDAERARLLPAGLLILEAAADLLGTTVAIGRGGIREGVLLQALRA